MNGKRKLIARLVEVEWDMFSKVQNIGGRALCQDDPATFEIMRSSQFIGWSEDALKSYLNDLEEAKKAGRNLPMEKYARMERSTSPSEYAKIEHLIPPLDSGVPSLVDKIVEIEIEWIEELFERFPYVIGKGRPIRSSQDSQFATSLETYLRGELETYSKRTLLLYYENILDKKSEGINGEEVIYENTVKRYGFKSLEEANKGLKAE
jgi:hypothetical protein